MIYATRKNRNALILRISNFASSRFQSKIHRIIKDETKVYCFYNLDDMFFLQRVFGKEWKIQNGILRGIAPKYIYLNLLRQDHNPLIYGDRILIFRLLNL